MSPPSLRGRGKARRRVVKVIRIERTEDYVNWVLVLECGHRALRSLWRDCSHVGCKSCSESRRRATA
jgi:hypothetical protein